MELVSRQRALREGLKAYFTGKPCKREHIAKRSTSNRYCRECKREWQCLYRAANLEKARATTQKWAQANPAKCNATVALYRQRKLDQVCACCSNKEREAVYQIAHFAGTAVDHIIPVSKGGMHCVHNMQLLSCSKNCSKSNNYDPLIEGLQYLQNLGLA